MIWQIHAPHMTAGLVIEGNYVVKTAPILGYMGPKKGSKFGWTARSVMTYCHKKGWKIVTLEDV